MNRGNNKFGKYFDMKKYFGLKNFAVIVPFVALAFVLLKTIPAVAAPPKQPATTKPELAQQPPATDSDKTLAAMQDELDRSRQRLELKIPGTDKPAHPYYIQYRVLDLDVHTIVAEFGALISSTAGRNRIMSVDLPVGDYNLDSSNVITHDD